MFFKVFEDIDVPSEPKVVNYRVAVRAVIMKGDKILLLHSNTRDYSFPGGGIEDTESHKEALVREVREETGYIDCMIKDQIGMVIERHNDKYDDQAVFQMDSHYYICELTSDQHTTQELAPYEADLGFTPVWVSLETAIEQNEELLHGDNQNRWVQREHFALKELTNILV